MVIMANGIASTLHDFVFFWAGGLGFEFFFFDIHGNVLRPFEFFHMFVLIQPGYKQTAAATVVDITLALGFTFRILMGKVWIRFKL